MSARPDGLADAERAEKARRRRNRSVAIALALAAAAALFYVMTIVRLGGSLAQRPL